VQIYGKYYLFAKYNVKSINYAIPFIICWYGIFYIEMYQYLLKYQYNYHPIFPCNNKLKMLKKKHSKHHDEMYDETNQAREICNTWGKSK